MSDTNMLRIIIADDHPLFRGALKQAISGSMTNAHIEEAGSFDELSEALDANSDVDLVLLDLLMPGAHGLSCLIYLRAEYPSTPIMIVSANEDQTIIRRCIELGATGFIPKKLETSQIAIAIRAALDGERWVPPEVDLMMRGDQEAADIVKRLSSLTPQQVRVLMMLSDGLLNKQIAHSLLVTEATVKAHVSAILQKLKVESRTQAVILASKIASGQLTAE